MTSHITASSPTTHQISSPNNEAKERLVQKLALEALLELSFAFAITGGTIFFSASTFAMLPLVALTGKTIVCNLALRASFLFLRTLLPNHLTFVQNILELAPAVIYQWIDAGRDELMHELGHAVAASLLYENADPKIFLLPMGRKTTNYNANYLSDLGESIGWKKADFMVTLAGPLVSFATATAMLLTAKLLPKNYKTLKRYLYISSITSILRCAIYADGAVGVSGRGMKGHDFVDLMRHGIDPNMAVKTILLTPLIAWFGLHILQSYRERASEPTSSQ